MRPIDADKLRVQGAYCIDEAGFGASFKVVMREDVDAAPTLDVKPVRRGEWVFEAHSFYKDTFDESIELCVYVTARCKDCGRNHPDKYVVYIETLYAPEDADEGFRFDCEDERRKVLAKFYALPNRLANYCPNCGAKMI